VARILAFVVLLGIGTAFFSGSILSLLTVSSNKELYSHLPLIPFVSLYFFLIGSKSIFSEVGWDYAKSIPFMAAAFLVSWLGRSLQGQLDQQDHLSLMMAGLFAWALGSFVLSYGASAARKAAFPLLFLVFIIPMPTLLLNPFVRVLQAASAETAHYIFKLCGVPVFREGFFLSLPGLTIEVAEQCSGIRSSISLFITSVVAGKLFLAKGWSRLALVLAVLPVTIFKNALRIVTLSLLGAYVDPRFITENWLHDCAGITFFVVALLFLLPVVWALRRAETRKSGNVE
jgi:exosortase